MLNVLNCRHQRIAEFIKRWREDSLKAGVRQETTNRVMVTHFVFLFDIGKGKWVHFFEKDIGLDLPECVEELHDFPAYRFPHADELIVAWSRIGTWMRWKLPVKEDRIDSEYCLKLIKEKVTGLVSLLITFLHSMYLFDSFSDSFFCYFISL